MRKTQNNLMLVTVIFAASLLTSNIISSNGMIYTGIFVTDSIQLLAPAAVLAYAITFLCTDIIGQLWGRKEANQAVILGLIAQIVCTFLIAATPVIFAPWFEGSDTYTALNGLGWFTVGSIIAYCCSQTWDVFVFHKIMGIAKRKLGEGYNKHRWIWNNASTMTSQIIDTVIFIGIGFGVGLGMDVQTVIGLMIGQYLVKFCIAIIDTPFFYFFTRKRNVSAEVNE